MICASVSTHESILPTMTNAAGSPAPSAIPPETGAFAPLRQPVFAVLWAATVLGNTGSFMRDVASSWLVTDLSASPAAVSLVQAAGTLPIFLLAIPAGVLSDILDRRKFLIAVQLLLACVSIALMALSHLGLLSVSSIVALTFLGGVGAALMGPTWQAIVPELVPRQDVKSAVALNSLGINIARSIGPAAGGLLLAGFGAAVTYGADVVSYGFVIAALLWWPRAAGADDALSERFAGAFRAGLRYTRASRELHVVLLRAVVFFAFASAIWALLPLVARGLLGGDAAFYGVMLGAVGIGAIGGALGLPALRKRMDSDQLLLGVAIVTAVVMAGLALAPPKSLAIAILLLLGAAWIVALTTLNGAAQSILPNWVRGRALAVYLTVFNGAMTAGSLCWGLVAQELGVPATLAVGAGCLLVAGILFHRVKLPTGDADLVASNHWPEPLTAEPVEHDRGPVLILIEYRIAKTDRAAFLEALNRLSEERRRDGAYGWGVTEDAADPEGIVEWFMVESWAEHLRQHKRVSHADADIQRDAIHFHIGPEKPVVRHFLTLDTRKKAGSKTPQGDGA
jgi:MFS family permease